MSSKNNQAGSIVILLISVLVALAVIYLSLFAPDQDGPMMDSGDVQQRIRPVVTLDDFTRKAAAAPAPATAEVEMAAPAVVETAVAARSAADLYAASCQVCHSTGAAGAPKLGNAADWSARVGNGYDALVQSALNGKGAMPPRGGSAFSDAEIGSIVQYMLDQAQ